MYPPGAFDRYSILLASPDETDVLGDVDAWIEKYLSTPMLVQDWEDWRKRVDHENAQALSMRLAGSDDYF